MTTHNFFSIIATIVSVLFCSLVFYSDPALANSQMNSSFFALQDIMTVCVAMAVLATFLSKKWFPLTLADYGVGLATLLGLIHYHFNQHPDITRLTLLGISYFVLRIVNQRTPYALKITSGILVLAGLAECWSGLRQLYGFSASNHHIYRLTGSFFNPGPYSGFLVIILPIALYWMLKLYKDVEGFSLRQFPTILRSPKLIASNLAFTFATLCFLSIVMLLPASMSRSAWIAGVAGCSIILANHYNLISVIQKYHQTFPRRFLICCSTGLVLLSTAGTGMYLMKKDSADGRLLMWKVSLNAIQENPWTGSGVGQFAGTYGQAQAEYFASGKSSAQERLVAGSPEYGFNEYLQIGVEFGIVGLLVFVGIVANALWYASRSKTQGTNAIIGSTTAILTFALFSYPFQVLPLCMTGIILLALLGNTFSPINLHRNAWLVRVFTVGLLVVSLWITRDKKIKREAYVEWSQEKTYFSMDIFKETVDHYRALYPRLKTEAVFLFEYGQCLSKTGQYEESNRMLEDGATRSGDPMFYNIIGKNYQALKQYARAEKAFRQASCMVPHRLYPHYLMAKMYFESGQTDKAIETAQKLIDTEPKIMSQAIKEMKKEMAKAIDQARQNITYQIEKQESPDTSY